MKLTLGTFTGQILRHEPENLPANAAQETKNCNFNGGSIVGVKQPAQVGTSFGAPVRGGIIQRDDSTWTAYTFAYDVDGVRSPVLQDSHKRFYWTGNNGGTKQFRFARQADNTTGAVTAVSTSYKVGVIASTYWDDTMASVGVTFKVTGRQPTVSLGALQSVTAKLWLTDTQGNLLRDITSSLSAGLTGVGTAVNGWHSSYTFSLSTGLDDLTKTTVSTVAYRQETASISLTPSNEEAVTALANLWYDGTTLKYVEIIGEMTRDLGTYSAGTQVAAAQWDGSTYASLGSLYIKTSRTLSYDNSAFPAGLLAGSTTTAAPDEARIAVEWNLEYNNQKYNVLWYEEKGLSDTLDVGGGVMGSIKRATTSNPTAFVMALEFGHDLPIEVRSYICTFVNTFGEESEPSQPIELTLNPGKDVSTVVITAATIEAKLLDSNMTADRCPLHGIRFYRTATASTGETEFYYAFTVKHSSLTAMSGDKYLSYSVVGGTWEINDTVPTAELGAPCPTQGLIRDTAELQNLQGLIAINGSMLAAFKKNEVWVCEPAQPWAWSPRGITTLPHPVVTMVPLEQGFVALTEGGAHYFSGDSPEGMMSQRIPTDLPCINKRAATALNGAVMYLSSDGPVVIAGMQAALDPKFSREKWREWFASASVSGAFNLTSWGHRALAYVPGFANGWLYDAEDDAWTQITTRVDYALHCPAGAFGISSHDNLAFGDTSNYWNLFGYAATTENWQWHSKTFTLPQRHNFGAVMLYGSGTAVLKVYADGVLRYTSGTTPLSVSGILLRLPSGFKAVKWSFKIEAQSSGTTLTRVVIATTPRGLDNE